MVLLIKLDEQRIRFPAFPETERDYFPKTPGFRDKQSNCQTGFRLSFVSIKILCPGSGPGTVDSTQTCNDINEKYFDKKYYIFELRVKTEVSNNIYFRREYLSRNIKSYFLKF